MTNKEDTVSHESVFEALYKRYYPRLCAYASRFVEEEETAEDIVQECFLKFYEKQGHFKNISYSSLLFAMVRNACIDLLRRKAALHFDQISYLSTEQGEERLYHVDFEFVPQDQLVYNELKVQIGKVIDSLPPKCREVFLMSRFEGLKNREIAERTQTSVTNVEKHITKALGVFAKYFKEHYPADIYVALLGWLLDFYLKK